MANITYNTTVYNNGGYSFDRTMDVSLVGDLNPFGSPSEATAEFLKGLKKTINKVEERIQTLSKVKTFKLNEDKWAVTGLDLINVDPIAIPDKTPTENYKLYFPVEMRKIVKLAKPGKQFMDKYLITIDIDNPTVLNQNDIPQGPLGSHFGYEIATIGSGEKETGHVWIKTFPGFPTRDRERMKALATVVKNNYDANKSAVRCIKPKYLIERAKQEELLPLPFDITTDNGVGSNEAFRTERLKKVAYRTLLDMHVRLEPRTFNLPHFRGRPDAIGYLKHDVEACFHIPSEHDAEACFASIESLFQAK